MASLQQILLGVFIMCLIAQSLASVQPSSRKLHPGGDGFSAALPRGFKSNVSKVIRPLASREEALVQDVEYSVARLRSLSGQKTQGTPVPGVPGGFSMELYLGNPAQLFSLFIDTGSDLVWVQCEPCTSCFTEPDSFFDPSKSSTYTTLDCNHAACTELDHSCGSSNVCLYSYDYADGSKTSGVLSRDTSSGTPLPILNFGCGTQNQVSASIVDGFVGLGLGSVSLTTQLYNTININKFLYCLPLTSSGYIAFGDQGTPSSSVVYTPLVTSSQNPGLYYVTLNDISINGVALNIPSTAFGMNSDGTGGVVFDSGTTFTLLAEAGYDYIRKALKTSISYPLVQGPYGLDLCFDVTGISQPVFPSVTFHFDKEDLELQSANVFAPFGPEGTNMCFLMLSSPVPVSIFGNTQQAGFEVVYDVDHGRLGWTPSQC